MNPENKACIPIKSFGEFIEMAYAALREELLGWRRLIREYSE